MRRLNFFISIIGLILGIFNYKSYVQLTKQQSEIVKKTNSISQAQLELEIDKRSQDYVDSAYNDLYSDNKVVVVIDELKTGRSVPVDQILNKIIDELEGIGSKFCQGTVKSRHIKITLKNTLSLICNNDYIATQFVGKKNGTAILCTEYFPDSQFAKLLDSQYVGSCEFIDSEHFRRGIDNNAKWLSNN